MSAGAGIRTQPPDPARDRAQRLSVQHEAVGSCRVIAIDRRKRERAESAEIGAVIGREFSHDLLAAVAPVLGVNALTQAALEHALRTGDREIERRRRAVARDEIERRVSGVAATLGLGPDDGIFFAAGKEAQAAKLAGLARTRVAEQLGLTRERLDDVVMPILGGQQQEAPQIVSVLSFASIERSASVKPATATEMR